MSSSGDMRDVRGALAPGCLQPEHHLPGAVDLHTLAGQRRARDVAAQLLECLAVMGSAAHGGVQTETLLVGTQRLHARSVSRHGTLHREHLLPGTRAEGNSIGAGRGLQRAQRTRVVRVGVAVGQVARPLILLDEHGCGTLGEFVMKALKRDAGVHHWGNRSGVTGAVGLLDRVAPLCFAAPVFFHSVRWYFKLSP